jgi:hypothetical protein
MLIILTLLLTSLFEAVQASDLYDFGLANGDLAWGNVRTHQDRVFRLNNNDNVNFKFYNEMFDQVILKFFALLDSIWGPQSELFLL